MQKKIQLILGIYIIILLLLGIGLGIYQKFRKMPLLEQAILEELLSDMAEEDFNLLKDPDPSLESIQPAVEAEGEAAEENDYWSKYQNEAGTMTDLASRIQSEISAGDKMQILYILQKSLDENDISFIISLINDGISSSEKSEIKALLQRKMSPEDQNEIKALALKYF